MSEYAFQDKNFFERFTGHLMTVCRHKKHVMYACFRMHLYAQGITHDLSKFSPAEFSAGVRYFDGHKSPNAVDRMVNGYSSAWLHHKGRNKHHIEYWLDFSGKEEDRIVCFKMPMRYVAEMVADRYAASKAYRGKDYLQSDPWDYHMKTRNRMIIDRDTRAVLDNALAIMRDNGNEAAFAFMRRLLAVTKGTDYTVESLGITEIMP